MVLAQANGHVGQQGSVADYLEVEPKYERAVEACLGDLLQYVIVPTHAQAQAGLDLISQENAGRCGFVVLEGVTSERDVSEYADVVSGFSRTLDRHPPRPHLHPVRAEDHRTARDRDRPRPFPTGSSPTISRPPGAAPARRRRPLRR